MNKTLIQIAKRIDKMGGNFFLVGGAIRDKLMGKNPLDRDFMVQGLEPDEVINLFSEFGQFEQVIGNAPVFMFSCNGQSVEIALARREISIGQGKHNFGFVVGKDVTLEDDLIRRDFTVNSLSQHFLTGKIFDPFNGQQDIEDKVLRPVSSAFVESPERVLRGMAFAARFGFDIDQTFIDFAIQMKQDFFSIPREQIWRHWEKMLEKGKIISSGLFVLQETKWEDFFPCLDELDSLNFWQTDKMVLICEEEQIFSRDRVILLLAVMSQTMSDRKMFLDSIGCPQSLQAEILTLAGTSFPEQVSSEFIKRLSVELWQDGKTTIEKLSLVNEAIFGFLPENILEALSIAERLDIKKQVLRPILQGKHLIQQGLKPGKGFGRILSLAFEAQLSEEFDNLTGALDWLDNFLKN